MENKLIITIEKLATFHTLFFFPKQVVNPHIVSALQMHKCARAALFRNQGRGLLVYYKQLDSRKNMNHVWSPC